MESNGSSPDTKGGADYLEPSTILPAQGTAGPQQVIGTLDLNQGVQCSDFGLSAAALCIFCVIRLPQPCLLCRAEIAV